MHIVSCTSATVRNEGLDPGFNVISKKSAESEPKEAITLG